MKYDFDTPLDRHGCGAAKYHNLPHDVIAMSVADMDFTSPPEVVEALHRRVDFANYGYTIMVQEDYQAIADFIQWRHGMTVPLEHLLATPGVLYTMRCAMYMLTKPGDQVVISLPLHTPSIATAGLQGRIPRLNWMKQRPDGNYTFDLDDLEHHFQAGARVLLMCNPHNPTGRVWTREELSAIAALAQEYDVTVVSDEVHRDLAYKGHPFLSIGTLPGMADRTITLNSFSKNFMMTGWRVGYIIAHSDLISVFQHINNGMTYVTPSISQRAALYALTIRQDIAEKYISVYKNRVYYAYERISQIPWLSIVKPRGTFYLFPRIDPAIPMKDGEFCKYLIENAHLLVSAGSAFGLAGQGHFRIAATVPQEKLALAMDRLAALEPPLR